MGHDEIGDAVAVEMPVRSSSQSSVLENSPANVEHEVHRVIRIGSRTMRIRRRPLGRSRSSRRQGLGFERGSGARIELHDGEMGLRQAGFFFTPPATRGSAQNRCSAHWHGTERLASATKRPERMW